MNALYFGRVSGTDEDWKPILDRLPNEHRLSTMGGYQMRVTFNNGYGISIIRHAGSYGSDRGLFEIAPIDKTGSLNGEVAGIDGDDVEGYLTAAQVVEFIDKIEGM